MKRDILFFIAFSYISGIVFVLAFIELILTVKRRKAAEQMEHSFKEIKARFNQTINKIVLDDDSKIEIAEKETEDVQSHLSEEKASIEKSFQEKIDAMTAESQKALSAAKAKAAAMEQSAKKEASSYLQSRQKEVEEELMNLVISVTKKVLPEGISYEGHKELVTKALRDVQTKKSN
jgi:flagellar biosynthesis/type III secretory pathway protein FliH